MRIEIVAVTFEADAADIEKPFTKPLNSTFVAAARVARAVLRAGASLRSGARLA